MPVRYPLAPYASQSTKNLPIRLSHAERKSMRLLSGIIKTMCYTDRVDTGMLAAKPTKRKQIQTTEIFNFCFSVLVGSEFNCGIDISEHPSKLKRYENKLCALIERLRRYKFLNPDRLRMDYTKFLFMLQDSLEENVSTGLNDIRLISSIQTVYDFCDSRGMTDLLEEKSLPLCVTPVPRIANRDLLNKALRHKGAVVRGVIRKYTSRGISESDVERALYSIADIKQFDIENSQPIRDLLRRIKANFSPFRIESEELNLGILANSERSRLTHSHEQQFFFVVQTLTFWRNILDRFHGIWATAEAEMLDSTNSYTLRDSGQGLQRIQTNCVKTFEEIQSVLAHTIEEVVGEEYWTNHETPKRENSTGKWIGSKKIHIGDEQVPNGMFFLDKYTQICRILNPIVRVLEFIEREDAFTATFIRTKWQSGAHLTRLILADFMRQGFDGSGGDTWDDAGSCIDGRLTSTWNWCNEIAEKEFYPIFRLAGFSSFDGGLGE
ncbi:hypothetical protein XU18_3495 [Perkinsela sp. CCAP 1560/4]|nr:hypothetical protein XU18_3495 [Perkinsela sp. CCAP 1560/4]|eukprot:KNH05524.1 hypothetical protein XU18_3495 [Perkinsela sp. CCAP 1560/4]